MERTKAFQQRQLVYFNFTIILPLPSGFPWTHEKEKNMVIYSFLNITLNIYEPKDKQIWVFCCFFIW